jgi:thermitase
MSISKSVLIYIITLCIFLQIIPSGQLIGQPKTNFYNSREKVRSSHRKQERLQLIVNYKDLPKAIKSGKLKNLDFSPLYYIDDHIDSVRKIKNWDTTKYIDDISVFYNVVLDKLSWWEKELHNSLVLKCKSKRDKKLLIRKLEKDSSVNFVEENTEYVRHVVANDPEYPKLWGLNRIRAEDVWRLTQGENVVVAVVDDGVLRKHRDIQGNLWTDGNGNYGRNFSGFGDFFDTNPSFGDYHGTHIAGTIAAVGNNGVDIIGVAPKAKIMPVKIFPFATDVKSANGVFYAIKNGAQVINNSWGPRERRPVRLEMNRILEIAKKLDINVVFSAGNYNDDVQYYSPANNPNVISVGSTDFQDTKSAFSNYGTLVSIWAPGESILSFGSTPDQLVLKGGTSMSAPHVSGVIALMKSISPSLTTETIRSILQKTSDPIICSAPRSYGRVNAAKAIEAVLAQRQLTLNIEVESKIFDQDNISNPDICIEKFDRQVTLSSSGAQECRIVKTSPCDGEVHYELHMFFSIDSFDQLRYSGTVFLFDNRKLEGSNFFTGTIPISTVGVIKRFDVVDPYNEDYASIIISIK